MPTRRDYEQREGRKKHTGLAATILLRAAVLIGIAGFVLLLARASGLL